MCIIFLIIYLIIYSETLTLVQHFFSFKGSENKMTPQAGTHNRLEF